MMPCQPNHDHTPSQQFFFCCKYVTLYSMITSDSSVGWDMEVTAHSLIEVLSKTSALRTLSALGEIQTGGFLNMSQACYHCANLLSAIVSNPLLTCSPTTWQWLCLYTHVPWNRKAKWQKSWHSHFKGIYKGTQVCTHCHRTSLFHEDSWHV